MKQQVTLLLRIGLIFEEISVEVVSWAYWVIFYISSTLVWYFRYVRNVLMFTLCFCQSKQTLHLLGSMHVCLRSKHRRVFWRIWLVHIGISYVVKSMYHIHWLVKHLRRLPTRYHTILTTSISWSIYTIFDSLLYYIISEAFILIMINFVWIRVILLQFWPTFLYF